MCKMSRGWLFGVLLTNDVDLWSILLSWVHPGSSLQPFVITYIRPSMNTFFLFWLMTFLFVIWKREHAAGGDSYPIMLWVLKSILRLEKKILLIVETYCWGLCVTEVIVSALSDNLLKAFGAQLVEISFLVVAFGLFYCCLIEILFDCF